MSASESRVLESRDKTAAPSPRQNRILGALSRAAYEDLVAELEPVDLPLGWEVYGLRSSVRYAYFPTSGIVSRMREMESGETAEFAMTGREGLVGIFSFLGESCVPSRAEVVNAGQAYRLRADRLRSLVRHDGELSRLLLRFALARMTQVAQVAAYYRHHPLEQQLSRKILSSLDRLGSNEMSITHDLLGRMLGVRRETITLAVRRLQQLGLIDARRGHITVRDRRRLESHTCECYAAIEREYARLLPPPRRVRGENPPGR